MEYEGRRRPRREPTVADLWSTVFGNPDIPGDRGAFGRLSDEMQQMRRLLWGVLITLITVMATLIVDLAARH